MENAKLGDSMVERLRAEGTAAEKEKEDAMSAWRWRPRKMGVRRGADVVSKVHAYTRTRLHQQPRQRCHEH